jgi:two-component system response regulator FixJ
MPDPDEAPAAPPTAPATPDQRIVHVVDDDPLLREGVALTLGDHGFTVTDHGSGEAFLAATPDLAPGCVLLDVHMPGMDGFQVLQALAARQVSWPVLVLTARRDVRTAVSAMKHGAFEFLEKPIEPPALLDGLAAAFLKLDQSAAEAARTAQAAGKIAALTPRELDVLRGLLAGLPNKLIAHQLDLSVRTVEVYRGRLMDKLEVRSLSSAIRMALACGVAPLEDAAEP